MEPNSTWALAWKERPQEEAHNFNPAFCGELCARTVVAYHKACRQPLSMATVFLILPLTLHRPTRDALPGRANTAFAGWVAENASLLAELPLRIQRLRSISREALMFSIHYEILAVDGNGVAPGRLALSPGAKLSPTTDDAESARRAAGLIGRWFAQQSSQSSILQGMGITP